MRRIHLTSGFSPRIHPQNIGYEKPRLVLHGRTKSGAEYEIVLKVDEWALSLLARRMKEHFVAQRDNDNRRHENRMSAFGGAS